MMGACHGSSLFPSLPLSLPPLCLPATAATQHELSQARLVADIFNASTQVLSAARLQANKEGVLEIQQANPPHNAGRGRSIFRPLHDRPGHPGLPMGQPEEDLVAGERRVVVPLHLHRGQPGAWPGQSASEYRAGAVRCSTDGTSLVKTAVGVQSRWRTYGSQTAFRAGGFLAAIGGNKRQGRTAGRVLCTAHDN